MNEITLEQFQLEIILCYHSQNNIPSFVDFLEPKTELMLENLSLSCFLNHIINTTNISEYISLDKL